MLSYIQQFIWVNSPNIVSSFADTLHREKKKYTDFDLDLKKAQNLVNDVYLNGFVANDLKIDSIKNLIEVL